MLAVQSLQWWVALQCFIFGANPSVEGSASGNRNSTFTNVPLIVINNESAAVSYLQ